MSIDHPILPRPRTAVLRTGPNPAAGGADAREGSSAENAARRHDPPLASPVRRFADALGSSAQATGWDPREVWLNRVHKPREGRRSW